MNLTTDLPNATPTARRRCRATRIDRSTIVLTVLSVVFALLVLLQMLPGGGAGTDAEPAAHVGATFTLAVFITASVLSVLVVAGVLLRATRGLDD